MALGQPAAGAPETQTVGRRTKALLPGQLDARVISAWAEGTTACTGDGLAGDILECASSPTSTLVGATRTQPRSLSEQKLPAAEHGT